jgi:hypothetical protein
MNKVRFCIASYLNANPQRLFALKACIYSILYQDYENIEIFIHHDGPVNDKNIPEDIMSIDNRIKFISSEKRGDYWGFPERRPTSIIEPLPDWVIYTNDDNYYVPTFVTTMLNTALLHDAGMVYCDFLHKGPWPGPDYQVLPSRVQKCWIDMGAFMTRIDVIQKCEWDVLDDAGADGIYAEKIGRNTKCVKAGGILYVHN